MFSSAQQRVTRPVASAELQASDAAVGHCLRLDVYNNGLDALDVDFSGCSLAALCPLLCIYTVFFAVKPVNSKTPYHPCTTQTQLSDPSESFSLMAFNSAQWIGCGKKFLDFGLPDEVEAEWSRLLQVPEHVKKPFFDPRTSIHDFLKLKLPRQEDIKVSIPPSSCFLKSPPLHINKFGDDFWRRTIPPADFTKQLAAAAGQAWLDGYTAIADWRFQFEPLPFWILTYWDDVRTAIKGHQEWKDASVWLRKMTKQAKTSRQANDGGLSENVEEVEGLFRAIGWGVMLKGLDDCVRANEIAHLLSTNWIREFAINALVSVCRSNLEQSDAVFDQVEIESTYALQALRLPIQEWSSYGPKGPFSHVHALGSKIESGSISRIFLPACVRFIHWAVYLVDIPARTISYGDSLGWSASPADVEAINRWLSLHNVSGFSSSNVLKCADQTGDNYSCGIIAANTIDHAILKSELWTPQTRESLRISKVIQLFENHLNCVRISYF